jgi:hypothetical protein
MELSAPQKRTARRVPSNQRLSLGKLSVMVTRVGAPVSGGRQFISFRRTYAFHRLMSMLAGFT